MPDSVAVWLLLEPSCMFVVDDLNGEFAIRFSLVTGRRERPATRGVPAGSICDTV